MPLVEAQRIPGATYRLQLHREFTFADAERLVPYLHGLGITDGYLSPVLLSAPGSQHGYDVNDYRRIDPELGGEAAFRQLSAKLGQHGMGVMLDFVPNHMGINGPFNSWWLSVLELGRRSPRAGFFDIQWNAHRRPGRARVLVPVLDDHYGHVLEAGRLQVKYQEGRLWVTWGDLKFPLSPLSYVQVLQGMEQGGRGDSVQRRETLRNLVTEFEVLAGSNSPAAEEVPLQTGHFADLKRRLEAFLSEYPELAAALEESLRRLNGTPGNPAGFDPLHELLEEQNYRLARWQSGAHETNYRRFFAIDSLIGLQMQNPDVFRESHMLIGRLLREGAATALRIDHIDGLWDPQEYLERVQTLRAGAPESDPLFVIVEKILEDDESLPSSWPAHGTTGYEFIGQLAGLFVDSTAESKFTEIYSAFTGRLETFRDVAYEKKRLVLEELFPNAVGHLAGALVELLQADRCWRDLTRHELTVAVREMMAGMEVYRTYRRLGHPVEERDRQQIERACQTAVERNARIDAQPFELVRDILTGRHPGEDLPEDYRTKAGRWAMTFQQYTGAVMAKAVEDTAFYTYNRFIALNEVGDDPARFGRSVADFHAANQRRLDSNPHSLLATSTHDTKWSEDVRARLYALSEIPAEWEAWLQEWRGLNQPFKTRVGGYLAPSPNEEYRLYQALLGAWPLEAADPNETFRERLRQYLRKSANEAKENTTWRDPNFPWLEAGDRFINAILENDKFLTAFRPKAIRLAHLGMVNSLAQLTLKITSPGVPDFYQGNELWDFSLVDPDNRRPVDYLRRQEILAQVQSRSIRDQLFHWRDGGIKMRVMQSLLRFRGDHALLFRQGDYHPLAPRGQFAAHITAFFRRWGEEEILVAVPRLTAQIGCPPLGVVWEDTALDVGASVVPWREVVTGRELTGSGSLRIADMFAELPLAVLHRFRG